MRPLPPPLTCLLLALLLISVPGCATCRPGQQLRQYEILLPLQFNDKREVPAAWLAEATQEIVAQFGGASYEPQTIEGYWRDGEVLYRDRLVKLVVAVPDTAANRAWLRAYKTRWQQKLAQTELWVISYPITVE